MRTTYILAAVAAATFSQVSASEPAAQPRYATYSQGVGLPQQTAYPQIPYSQDTASAHYSPPSYNAYKKAISEAVDTKSDIPNPAPGPAPRGQVNSLATEIYGFNDKSKGMASANTAPNNVAPNNAAMSAPPSEELLGPFSGVAGTIESSIESSILGKVTSLPANEASKLQSSIQAKESSILGTAPSNGTHASTTKSASREDVTGSADAESKETGEAKKKESGSKEDEENDMKSDAMVLSLGWESLVGTVLFVLGMI